MNLLRSTLLIARKDLKLFFRDRSGMVLGFLLPVALVGIFGFVMKFAFGGGSGMPRAALWVSDEDGSEASRRFLDLLRASDMLRVQPEPEEPAKTAADLRKLLQDGEAHHALILGKGFGAAVDAGGKPPLRMLRDPGRIMEDRIIGVGLMQAFMEATEGRSWPGALGGLMRKTGMDEKQVQQIVEGARGVQSLIAAFTGASMEEGEQDLQGGGSGETEPPTSGFEMNTFLDEMVPLETEDLTPPDRPRQVAFQLAQAVSGVTVMMLMFGLMATSSMLLKEREEGTLLRLLVSPVSRVSVLWGKFLFSAVIGMLQLVVLFAFGEVLFHIQALRDPVTLLILCFTWVAAATSFGMLISAWARTPKQAEGLSTLLILVMAALGGCWFPVQIMDLPLVGRIATHATLTWWAMSGFQGMFWDGLSWTHPRLLFALGVQWAFVLAASWGALVLFRRRYTAG
ncbi:MAG: ABC transporter permease [Planctomycetota bacterium]